VPASSATLRRLREHPGVGIENPQHIGALAEQPFGAEIVASRVPDIAVSADDLHLDAGRQHLAGGL
jgi:hypothetical protein